MRLVMNQDHLVYSKMVHAGEQFEVPDEEGEQWVKLGWARPMPAVLDEAKRRGRYARRDLRSEPELQAEDE